MSINLLFQNKRLLLQRFVKIAGFFPYVHDRGLCGIVSDGLFSGFG